MMSHFNDDAVNLVGHCTYTNLASVNVDTFTNSVLHLNMRSIRHKTAELEVILNLLGLPKVIMITETWLTSDTSLTNITGYSIMSSPRTFGRGGGAEVYVHDSIKYRVKAKSCEINADCYIAYLLLELIEYKLALCFIYCPPRSTVENIASTIESFKRLVSNKYNLIVGGDFNVNLLDLDDDNAVEFFNAVNLLALHPTITLPTRVTNTTISLIDNFLCDFSFRPANTNVITTDISDHYTIALHILNIVFCKSCNETKL